MDDYGVSPLMMMRLLSPLLVIGPIVLWFLVMGPFVLYLVARWRAHREPVVDPQLGLKTLLHYFGMIGLQFTLFGTMMIVWMIVTKEASGDRGDFLRVAFGFLIPALIIYFLHLGLLKKTNQRQFMGVTRLFQGYNLLITGLVGVTAFFLVFQALFAKGSSGEMGRISAALLVVYGSAWAVSSVMFARTVYDASQAPPYDSGTPTSPAPPQPASTSGGHSLPSLGGGAYPPIAPK